MLGPGYYGVAVSALAYGVVCCQTLYYFQSERAGNDPRLLRMSIGMCMLLLTAQQIFIIHAMHRYLIGANPCAVFQHAVWSIPADIALHAPILIIVGGFLVYRTWRLGGNLFISGVCGIMTLVASALAIACSIQLWSSPTLLEIFIKLQGLGIANLVAFVAADTCTSAVLVWYLYRKRTGFRRTDSLVTRLIRLTVSTNALTTIFTLSGLVAYVAGTHGFYVTIFSFLLDKLYLNAMLTTLNMRGSLNNTLPDESNKGGVNMIPPAQPFRASLAPEQSGHPIAISVDRIVEAENVTLPTPPVAV